MAHMMATPPPLSKEGTLAIRAQQRKPAKQPFMTRVNNPEPVGLSRPRRQDLDDAVYHASKAKKKASVLTAHRRWLRDLAAMRKKIQSEKEAAAEERAERYKRFLEKGRRHRLAVLGESDDAYINNTTYSSTGSPRRRRVRKANSEEYAHEADRQIANEWVTTEDFERYTAAPAVSDFLPPMAAPPSQKRRQTDSPRAAKARNKPMSEGGKPVRRKSKPMWAKTADEIVAEEDNEVDELLDFAADLDFDKFIGDAEARAALAVLKNRVEELEATQNEDENEECESECGSEYSDGESAVSLTSAAVDAHNARTKAEARKRRRRYVNDDGSEMEERERGWDTSTTVASTARDEKYEKSSRMLSVHRELKKVHSTRSVRNIIQKIASEDGNEGVPPASIVRYLPSVARELDTNLV